MQYPVVIQISLACGKRKPPLLSAVNAGFAAMSGKVIYLTSYSENIQFLNGFSASVHIHAVCWASKMSKTIST